MKNAIITAAAVTVLCPICKEPQPEPSTGSHMWDTNNKFPPTVRCADCGNWFAVVAPKRVSL